MHFDCRLSYFSVDVCRCCCCCYYYNYYYYSRHRLDLTSLKIREAQGETRFEKDQSDHFRMLILLTSNMKDGEIWEADKSVCLKLLVREHGTRGHVGFILISKLARIFIMSNLHTNFWTQNLIGWYWQFLLRKQYFES